MNEATQRLFQAAKELKNINLPSELARFLNVSQQVIKKLGSTRRVGKDDSRSSGTAGNIRKMVENR